MTDTLPSDNQPKDAKEVFSSPPHGLKGVLKADPILTPSMVIGVGVFVLLCVALIIVLNQFLKKIKDSGRRTGSTTGVPALIEGPGLLNQIDQVALPLESHSTENDRLADWARFSSALSVILRRAVELRTGLPVAERTTQEIYSLLEIGDKSLSREFKDEIFDLLLGLDEITFAGRISSINHASVLLAKVRAFVKILTEADLERADSGESVSSGVKIFE